jgi:hypothetical protein
MGTRSLAACAALLLAAITSCVDGAETAQGAAPPQDVPLELTVDSVDVVHGALRLIATMVDGAADVRVTLGGDCERREVGGGFSTVSTFIWALGADDVADAIGCGLAVQTHVRTATRTVTKVAELAVNVGLAPFESDDSEAGPRVQDVTASSAAVNVVFVGAALHSRLVVGDSSLEASSSEEEGVEGAGADGTAGRFSIPPLDFARALLLRRPAALDGALFEATLEVGGTALAEAEP